MKSKLPTGLDRVMTGGRTAAKVGTKVLAYCVKRPFLSDKKRSQAKKKAALESAESLFQGLSLLKGTALKMAQQLSLEFDLLPEAVCRELSKAYHQVPPINRALVRKLILSGLGQSPEEVFSRFETKAFAAASLGQVHRAWSENGRELAVKIQYPGIAQTINGDVKLLRHLMRPVVKDEQLLPTLDEIAARLHEEVDYQLEADNLCYFADHLHLNGVRIPKVLPEKSSKTILTTTMMPGKPLDVWLKDNPDQEAKNHVARQLNHLILTCLYELGVIHADPNPGNFIIADDLTIGLVDFGCTKRLSSDFIEKYRSLVQACVHNDVHTHLKLTIQLGLIPKGLDAVTMKKVKEISTSIIYWFSRLYAEKTFDFSAHEGFIAQGQLMMRQYHDLFRHFKVNPDFIFLDRTRYGLLRIYEMMEAEVPFRNAYEW